MTTNLLTLSQKRQIAKLVRENDKGLIYHRFRFENSNAGDVGVYAYASNANSYTPATQWVWVGYAGDLLDKYTGERL